MKRFKEYFKEGRDKWDNFTLKRTNKRWSFNNTTSGKKYYIKLDGNNVNYIGDIQKFLNDLKATDGSTPKTKGEINYGEFAGQIVSGEKTNIHVKSGNFDKIKNTWIID